ncbi:MAG TPA: prephenate dehydratase [Gallionellaceae bacterium]|nr:prephenate dehydratase [Gallionellaceae bacterium]
MSEKLTQYRDQIDRIDDELLRLLNARARLAQQIGHEKGGGVVLRPEREAQVLRRLCAANPGPLSGEAVTQLYTEIMSQCRALEAPQVVAYLGPEGSFSEAAMRKRFGRGASGLPVDTFDEIFRAVESGNASYGVVPVENSSEGMIGHNLDLLLVTPAKVCGEVALQVHQCLMSHQADKAAIMRVYSHPQSLGQCRNWLNANLPGIERVAVSSNAEAARRAAAEPESAAVAGLAAAERYGVPVRAGNIEDDPRNTTRFLVIGDQEVAPSGCDKTSLVLSAPNRPGAVHALLGPLAEQGVSMTKLESRPARSGLWEYVYYVDIEGHQCDQPVAAALAKLKEVAAFVKVLGSYPAAA